MACLRCCLTFFPRGTVVSTDCAAAQTVAVGSGNFYNDEAFKQDGVGSGNFYNNVGPESLCMGICPLLSLLGPRADRSGDSKLVATKLWCGIMPFTLRCGAYGFVPVESADLWNGWNLETRGDADLVLDARRRHRLGLVVASVECTPWCHFNVDLNYPDQQEKLAELQQKAAIFLSLCEEQPSSSPMIESARRLQRTCPVQLGQPWQRDGRGGPDHKGRHLCASHGALWRLHEVNDAIIPSPEDSEIDVAVEVRNASESGTCEREESSRTITVNDVRMETFEDRDPLDIDSDVMDHDPDVADYTRQAGDTSGQGLNGISQATKNVIGEDFATT